MKFKIALAVFVQVGMLLDVVVTQPDIQVIPAQINLGLTSSLKVNCNFSLNGASDMTALMSLIVARANKSSNNFEELASITTYSNGEVTKLTSGNFSATGSFTPFGKSHLQLQWTYPNDIQGGVYKCLGQGLDSIGHVVSMTDTEEVKVQRPSSDNYNDKVKEIDMQMKTFMRVMSDMDLYTLGLEKKILELEQNLSASNEYTKGLEQRVSQLAMLAFGFKTPLTYNNHTYHVSTDPFTTIEYAVVNCKLLGGYVVEIDDRSEYDAIKQFLQNAVGYRHVIIAGSDEENEGTWLLPSTKKPLPNVDWYGSQPNGGRNENCLMFCRGSIWALCDLPCAYGPFSDTRYMCEVP